MVKQESHTRHRSVALPVRSLTADLVDRGAEAGGTDQRAVRAGQTATGHVVPLRVLGVRIEHVAQPVGVERTPHVLCCLGAHRLGFDMVLFPGSTDVAVPGAGRQVVEDLLAAIAARDEQEAVPVPVEQLGER